MPKQPLETMSPRHSLGSLRGPSKGNTTLVPPSMMPALREDIAAINRGEGVKQGNRFTINGRTYVQKDGGTFYPADGPGFIGPLDRGTHNALMVMKVHGGLTEAARFRLAKEGTLEEQLQLAEHIWLLREREMRR
ncbi:MAG: hypothetical protein ACTHQE_02165 [Thermomicrobiales bacterium]